MDDPRGQPRIPDAQPSRWVSAACAAGVFLTVLLVHAFSKNETPYDSRWTIHTTLSILREGNTDLSEYEPILARYDYYAIERIDGRPYTLFPVGTSVLVTPFVFVVDRCESLRGRDLQQYLNKHIPGRLEKVLGSVFVALTGVMIFGMARREIGTARALAVVFVFAFCTSAWSTASRALWQHGPSMCFLTAALYLIVASDRRKGLVAWASLPLAMSFVVRPTNAIPIALLSGWVLVRRTRQLLLFVLGGVVIAGLFAWHNYALYHAPVPPYFRPGRISHSPYVAEALLGNLISPARGVLVYSPVLLFALAGIGLRIARGPWRLLACLLAACIVLHWVAISRYHHWWAGHSIGPRLFTDMVPLFMFFLIPVVGGLRWRGSRFGKAVVAAFVLLAAFSSFTHWQGANLRGALMWNGVPNNIDEHPERLWDWSDPQFLRFRDR